MACSDFDLMAMMLRVLVDDLDETDLTYTDSKLKKIIATASKIVVSEVILDQTYTVTINFDTESYDVCPAVTDLTCSLIVTKAACMINNSEARFHALMEGIRASCGPVQMQKAAGAAALNYLFEYGPCATYEELKEKSNFKDPLANATYFRGIMTPFINERFKCNQCGGYRSGCGCTKLY